MRLDVRRLPVIDPLMKLTPIIKLSGNFTVSVVIKLIFTLFILFCIPIIKSKNKDKLNETAKKSFLKEINIHKIKSL